MGGEGDEFKNLSFLQLDCRVDNDALFNMVATGRIWPGEFSEGQFL